MDISGEQYDKEIMNGQDMMRIQLIVGKCALKKNNNRCMFCHWLVVVVVENKKSLINLLVD
jgi:hypothetical protein